MTKAAVKRGMKLLHLVVISVGLSVAAALRYIPQKLVLLHNQLLEVQSVA